MAVVGTLSLNLLANATGVQTGLNAATRAVTSFQARVQSVGAGLAGQLTAGLGAAGLTGFFGWGTKLAMDAETAQASFTILAGSAAKARTTLAEIKQFSQTSPLSQQTLRDAASTMLQFGVQSETILPTLRQLGDLSMGNSERLGSMALAFGQMTTAGRLMGQDLLQMINAGFNPLQEISRKTGESMKDLKARMEAGGISSKEVADAFASATEAGGRFHGMLAARSATSSGSIDKLRASVANLAQQFGEVLIPALQNTINAVSPVVKWMSSLSSGMKSNIVAFGALATATTIGIVALASVVRAIQAVIGALRAMAMSQAIVQALSGPKGWLALAASAAVAAGAVAMVAGAFKEIETKAVAATKESAKVAGAVQKVAEASEAIKFTDAGKEIGALAFELTAANSAAEKLKDMLERGAELTKQMRTPGEEFADRAGELRDLLAIGAISGETFRRAMADARKNAADARGDIEAMRKGPGGAADINTAAGFSAVQSSLRERDAQIAEQRQADADLRMPAVERLNAEQLAEARKQTAIFEDLSTELVGAKVSEPELQFLVANF